jgi:spermidine synthase
MPAVEYIHEESPLQDTSTAYPITRRLFHGQTQFAEVDIVENPQYGRMLFLDKELQSASSDERIYHETLVHPIINSMSGHSDMRVLVVGGAEGATVREVLRWSPNKIAWVDWVDIDRDLVDQCREHLCYTMNHVYEDRRVAYFGEDIMQYLGSGLSIGVYDIIIIDLPDPDPDNSCELYKQEFWRLILRALKPGGEFVTHCGPVVPGRLGAGSGLEIVRSGLRQTDPNCHIIPYHTYVPSFQGEWGFVMSRLPIEVCNLPDNCDIMNTDYQRTIFHWDRHWGVNE